jgi:hypothetical protein
MVGLLPGLPRAAYSASLMIIPPGLGGGLVGVVAIAVSQRRSEQTDRGDTVTAADASELVEVTATTAAGAPADMDDAVHRGTAALRRMAGAD